MIETAKKYGKTPGQVALRWAIQRGTIVMPKTERVERLRENIDVFDFELNADEMQAISKLNKNERYLDSAEFVEKNFNTFIPTFD